MSRINELERLTKDMTIRLAEGYHFSGDLVTVIEWPTESTPEDCAIVATHAMAVLKCRAPSEGDFVNVLNEILMRAQEEARRMRETR